MSRTLTAVPSTGAALLLAWMVASLACNKDAISPGADAMATTTAEPVTTRSLPPRTDEEQKANREITSENYKAQLDQLEGELDPP